jgi:hypothetical protein
MPLETYTVELVRVAIWDGQEAESEFTGPGGSWINHFIDLSHVAFCADEKAKTCIGGPGDHLKFCSLDLAKVVIWAGQEA